MNATDQSPRRDQSFRGREESPPTTLVARLKSREPAAWRELDRQFGPPLRAFAQRLGLKPEDGEDVVQDAFLALFEHAADLDEKSSHGIVLAWLRTVVKRKVTDHFREEGLEAVDAGGSCAEGLLAEAPGRAPATGADTEGGDSGHWAAEREAVRRARAGMEDKTWRAYVRHVVDERPMNEVAAELHMTVDSVRNATYRVPAAARRELDALAH